MMVGDRETNVRGSVLDAVSEGAWALASVLHAVSHVLSDASEAAWWYAKRLDRVSARVAQGRGGDAEPMAAPRRPRPVYSTRVVQ